MADVILILTAGSSSLKFSAFFDRAPPEPFVRGQLEALNSLAPLHNPPALAGLDTVLAHFPQIPHVERGLVHRRLSSGARTLPRSDSIASPCPSSSSSRRSHDAMSGAPDSIAVATASAGWRRRGPTSLGT